jgi:endoglucanase
LRKTHTFSEILSILTLAALIFTSTAASTNNVSTTINLSGIITTASGVSLLHVDGNKIKDISGNVVFLRGVDRPEGSDSDGSWMGNTFWNDANARTELSIIKSWGANVIRQHISVDLWVNDAIDSTSILHNRAAIKRVVELAAEQGLYVIFDGYSVMASNRDQDPLPYPPYQAVLAERNVIANQQQFVNFMADFANQLKGYSNVIFEMWNEPNGDSVAKASYFDTVQQCISAIRSTGSQNLIVVQWDYGGWVNLDFPSSANSLSWVFNYPLNDSAGNIVYSTHLYRSVGHIQKGGGYAYSLADVDAGLRAMLYYDVAQRYPLFVGEVGAVLGGSDQAQELEFFNNALNLFNQHGIGYCAWVWGNWGLPLNSGSPNFAPTVSGNILKNYLQTPAS